MADYGLEHAKFIIGFHHNLGGQIGMFRFQNGNRGKDLKELTLFDFALWSETRANEQRVIKDRIEKEIIDAQNS